MPVPKTIGSLNSGWAILTRFMLATYPFVIAWCVWVTSEQLKDRGFRLYGLRVSQADLDAETNAIWKEIHELPPQDTRTRLDRIERKGEEMLEAIHENSKVLAEIKVRIQ